MQRAGHVAGVALTLALVVATVAAVGAVGGVGEEPAPQVEIDADSVQLQADIGEDGDAQWRVVYRIRLDDDNATEAFRTLRTDIEADPSTYLDPFRSRMERTVASAENATGRSMSVENTSVRAELDAQPQVDYGIVTYRLTWIDFAVVDGDRLRAGDALDRLFLDATTSLEFTWPEGYRLQSGTPEPTRAEETRVVWQGRRDFDAGEPRVTLSPAGTTPAATVTATPTDGPGEGGGVPVAPLAVLVVLAVAVGAWLSVRGGGPEPDGDTGGESPGDTGATGEAGDTEGPPPELLSNEERVLRLLEENGGRMKQKAVAETLDWTAAKTSQVVGDLRDEGKLDSFRLGRENVLTLPEVDIEPEGDES